jgi:hypothetical protein
VQGRGRGLLGVRWGRRVGSESPDLVLATVGGLKSTLLSERLMDQDVSIEQGHTQGHSFPGVDGRKDRLDFKRPARE